MYWKLTYSERTIKVEVAKGVLGFGDIYGQGKALADKKGRSCGQYAFINACLWLGVPISKDPLNKQFHTRIKVDTSFVHIIQAPCVANSLKFGNIRFEILKYGMV